MNNLTLSLITNKQNEINKFLSTYFTKEMDIDEKTFKWTCVYTNPIESVNLMTTLIDNSEKFDIETILQMDRNVVVKVNDNNVNDLVKFMYERYN